MDTEEKGAGQRAYEAYYNRAGGVSLVTGEPIPTWVQLPGEIQEAWDAAGTAVVRWYGRKLAQELKTSLHPLLVLLGHLADAEGRE